MVDEEAIDRASVPMLLLNFTILLTHRNRCEHMHVSACVCVYTVMIATVVVVVYHNALLVSHNTVTSTAP